jgi:hypothetical protein
VKNYAKLRVYLRPPGVHPFILLQAILTELLPHFTA